MMKWSENNAMKIKMGCSLMILHILGSQTSGELSKIVREILYLDGQLSIYFDHTAIEIYV